MRNVIAAAAFAAALSMSLGQGLGPALASDSKGSHKGSHDGHGQMKALDANKEAAAVGVINSVDASAGKINITHEPVPELGWPKMTMDLPVTRRVDLSNVKPGMTVNFSLKQGRDKQFRVISIEPKK